MNRSDAARRAHELRRERDELLEHEIPEDLVDVWRALGAKRRSTFRAGPRRSRGEAFTEWAHDHGADVERIALDAHEARVAQWLREEPRALASAEPAAYADLRAQLAHLPPDVAARLASRAPGSCLAKWGRRPAHRKECPGCKPAPPPVLRDDEEIPF